MMNPRMLPLARFLLAGAFGFLLATGPATVYAADGPAVLRPENLVAWCIVPFDAKKRSPAQRAAMLQELGLSRCAYDWRNEHVPTFEQEILEYKKHDIEFFAFWGAHDDAFRLFQKYDLHPQIWQTVRDPGQGTQEEKVAAAVQQLLPLAKRTQAIGCQLGLYNHGGWGGEPANMVAVCQGLRAAGQPHVGIVYNFHHGHGHIDDWDASWALLQPYVLCLNLNGMNAQAQPKILGIGKGAHEKAMIRTVVASGYDGPIGILDHRPELDAKESLQENRDGLKQLRQQLAAAPQQEQPQQQQPADDPQAANTPAPELPYDAQLAPRLLAEAFEQGDALRGAAVYANAKWACISCHKVGQHGGSIGPELTAVAKDRPARQIVESVLWPKREVKPEFVTWQILTLDGKLITGYKHATDKQQLTLRDPASGKLISIPHDDIDAEVARSTVMPDGLTAGMTQQQRWDLFRFLSDLGAGGKPLPPEFDQVIAHSQMQGPSEFPLTTTPLQPGRWANLDQPINQHRLYDFYTKQAEHFRQQHHTPMLLAPFEGIDGPAFGHWGSQKEGQWADERWNETQLGPVQAGVVHLEGQPDIARGVCVRLGDQGELAACFNPDTLTYDAVWSGGFVRFSGVRHGFVGGLQIAGERQATPPQERPDKPFVYHGYYRLGTRTVFAYQKNGVEYLDSPWVRDGKFYREVAPVAQHSLRQALEGGPAQWPQRLKTPITPGVGRPYAVDTIGLPTDNPWKALLFCGGHDFLPDGAALVCTMQGDVWRVDGLDGGSGRPGVAQWRRFASGLHHPLGLVVTDGEIYVQCRDQLTRLVDQNHDGEADFYECFSNAFETSPAGHDFICGLQRDKAGNFYTASGNQGLLKISPDGKQVEVIATGFRNPDGLGILPGGMLTVPCSEGDWTPASMICAVPPARQTSYNTSPTETSEPPHFGYRGPRNNQPPSLPLAYLPRGLDNSSGGQAYVQGDQFGPLQGQLLHLSFGTGTWFLVLRDEVDGQAQGAIVPLAGSFDAGAHRGRFRPQDGQFYVSGMAGWGTYTPDDGSFQRVRYTGDTVQVPLGFHTYENGVRVTFAQPLDSDIVTDLSQHYAQCWNYRYSGAYGSPDYSTTHPGVAGHDPLKIASAHLLPDGRSLFLEIPDLQPVNQLHLRMHVNRPVARPDAATGDGGPNEGQDLFLTVHKLDGPFTDFPGYQPQEKTIAAHPLLSDMALNAVRVPNPWRKKIADVRRIQIDTGKNLTFATREIHVKANEPLQFTLANPDVVPHNWVLVQPGSLQQVGELANQLIASPDAFARHYVPKTEQVLFYTDIVSPSQKQTIYFRAPAAPGRYPFLCTFPGHWMVMNGVMVVE
ncbi:DUF6797 domain-containing protein [Lignipirellula cremea]|uniref:Auracyanin-A n=1 Tax=Lignipirellula cremea TaxID=2528010 RepID=A0A518DLG5_9BACT|nr:DUF6797 domain-containing protein [Lignipirellula cremea]QDU92679.1 Auracyanin-A precursor [Lignipirellula cremea]